MSYYVASVQKPTAVVDSVAGNFTSPTDLNLVIARPKHVEFHLVTPEGLCLLKEFNVQGRIGLMLHYRPPDSNKDLLFIVTTSFKAMFLEASIEGNDVTIVTKSNVDVFDTVGIQAEGGFIAAVDSSARVIGMSLYQGIFTMLLLDKDWKKLKRTTLRLHELAVIDMKFLHGCVDPTLVVLHKDYGGRNVTSHAINLREREFRSEEAWKQINVETEASKLITVPAPIGGILVVGSNSIAYHNGNHSVKQPFTGPISCYNRVDDKGLQYLLGCLCGQLYRISLTTEESETGSVVKHIKVQWLGEISIPQSITYLGNDLAFIGSCDGDSQLVRIGLDPLVLILKEFPNFSPIRDMVTLDLYKNGQCQVVTCSGTGKDGSLRSVRNAIDIKQHASIDLSGIKGMWSLKVGNDDSLYDNTLVLAFVGHTLILTLSGEEVEETDIPGFDSNLHSLLCANVDYNQLIQVTSESVRLVKSATKALVGEWKPDGDRSIGVVSCNTTQIVLASASEIFYICIEDGSLVEKCRKSLPYEVACLDVTPLDEKQNKSDFVAVGLWTDISAVILSLPDLETIYTEKLSEGILPRSLLMTTFRDAHFLLCGLGDGSLIYFIMDSAGQLMQKKKLILSMQPITLRKIGSSVFAYTDRLSMVYASKHYRQWLSVYDININEVDNICSLNTEAYSDSLAVATKSSVILCRIDANKETALVIRSYPLGKEPRRIAHQAESQTFAVSTVHREVRSITNTKWVKKLKPQPTIDKTREDGAPNKTSIPDGPSTSKSSIPDGPSTSKSSLADGPCTSKSCIPDGPSTSKTSIPKEPAYVQEKVITTEVKEIKIYHLLIIDQHRFNILETLTFTEEITSIMSAKLGEDHKMYYVVGTEKRLIVFYYDLDLRTMIEVAETITEQTCHTLLEFNGKILAGISATLCLYEWRNEKELLLVSNSLHIIAIKELSAKDDFIIVGDLMRSITLFQHTDVKPFFKEVARDTLPKWTSCTDILDDNAYLVGEKDHLFLCRLSSEEEKEKYGENYLVNVCSFHLGDKVNVIRHGSMVTHNVRERIATIKGESRLYSTNYGGIGIIAEIHEDYGTFFKSLQKKLKSINKMVTTRNSDDNIYCSNSNCRRNDDDDNDTDQRFIDGDLIQSFLNLEHDKMDEVVAGLEISNVEEVIDIVVGLKELCTSKAAYGLNCLENYTYT